MTSPPTSTTFYSQHGEDALLIATLGDLERGTFVEVGCIDGRRFSNTLALEQAGWTGLCVEAHPDYIDLLRRNRSGSMVAHAAVTDRDGGEITLHANSRGALSTLDPSRANEFRHRYGRYFTGFEPMRVPRRTLSSLLDEHGLDEPDVVSIDVDGCDAAALRGLDLRRHRPRVLIIEADTPEDTACMDRTMGDAGYEPPYCLASNRIYYRERARAEAARSLTLEVEITWTEHPHDECGDEIVRARIPPRDMGEAHRRITEALRACAREGITRVAIYGAGRHTLRAREAIENSPVEIACFIDDNPERIGTCLGRIPIVSRAWAMGHVDRLDAVVLSSDTLEDRLREASAPLGERGVRIVSLYDNGPVAAPAASQEQR